MVGGALTGAALLLEQPRRATELMLFCLSRSLQVCFRALAAAGWVVPVPRGDALLFAGALAMFLGTDRRDLKSLHAKVLTLLFGRQDVDVDVDGWS